MNILITGGSGELGQEIISSFSDINKIYNLSRNNCNLSDFYYCDLSSTKSIDLAVKKIYKDKIAIDCIIINSAVTSDRTFLMENHNDSSQIMNINILNQLYLIKKLFRKLCLSKSPNIIFISSACVNFADKGLFYYSLSKSTMIESMKLLASEFSPYSIRVNSISPSFIDTSMFKKNSLEYVRLIEDRTHNFELIKKSDIINVISLILSSPSINGKNIILDNGTI